MDNGMDELTQEQIDELRQAFRATQDKERALQEDRDRADQMDAMRYAFEQIERREEAKRRAVIIGTGRRNGKDLDAQIVAAACAAGIDPTSEDFADLIRRVSEKLKEVAVAIHDMVDIVVAAINEAWQPMMDAWEEIQKLIEQCEYADEPEEEDRHDGTVKVLVTWLLPVPTLYELYGQGVDHGGPGPSRLTLTRVTDDGLRRAETGQIRKGENTMIIFLNILLGLIAFVLFLGTVGEKDGARQKNITMAFVATLAAIVLINFVA